MKCTEPLKREFYLCNAVTLAKKLLGKGIWVEDSFGPTLAKIVEVEAYLGSEDPASHAFRGMTARNRSMFEIGGTCYVYLSYGVHHCLNVVSGARGSGQAVLIRAAEILEGLGSVERRLKQLKKSRSTKVRLVQPPYSLLSGPGKLARGLGIQIDLNGSFFDQNRLKLVDIGLDVSDREVGVSQRIGISKGVKSPYRFFVINSPSVSRGRVNVHGTNAKRNSKSVKHR